MSEDEKFNWWLPVLIIIFVFLAWGFTWHLLEPMENRGTFGDMFGAVNALFSGLAFGGVIVAIVLQGKELKLQRIELKLTRNELKDQNSTLKKQKFENTFFELLRLHNDITNSIDLFNKRSGNKTTGRDCFKVFYARLKSHWGPLLAVYQDQELDELEKINKVYMSFYNDYQSELGHYFRSLFNIVKFVDKSDVEDKRLYTNLIRAQLSSYELLMIFYNVLSDMGKGKFSPYVTHYSLLKTLPRSELIDSEKHFQLYNAHAYGDK